MNRAALFLILAAFCNLSPAAASGSTLFYNGKIITMDPQKPVAEALLVAGKKIIATGSSKKLLKDYPDPAQKSDLAGRIILPGFVEAHGHLYGVGKSVTRPDLRKAISPAEVIRIMASRVPETPAGRWITGRGWDQNLWKKKEFPVHHELSAAIPDHPVRLGRVDGHAAWYNLKAMKLAGITSETPDPEGGRIIRDRKGRPTGVFIDTAMRLIDKIIPPPDKKQRSETILAGIKALHQLGVTSFHDAGVDRQGIGVYQELSRAGRLSMRIFALISGRDQKYAQEWFRKGPQSGAFLNIRSFKLMADGALGSRGAALLNPYRDEPGNSGKLILQEKTIADFTEQALRAGFQVATHAIGDRANRVVLRAYEKALRRTGIKDHRLRTEHAQLLAPEDIKRMKKLGVIASMQPTHCSSDMPWVPTRIGEQASRERAYIWNTLLRKGIPLAFGSDAPVESPDPVRGIYAALYRAPLGQTRDSANMSESLSIDQALQAYTTGAAYAGFREHDTGVLKKGYLADLIVLNKDITTLRREEFSDLKVVLTMLDGNIVWHDQKGFPKDGAKIL